jgi:ABC-type nitrate/sulfonate/bicarbonate transport system substrate-binding protein
MKMLLKATAAIFLLLAAACGNGAKAGTVRYIGYKVYDPVYVAIDRGLFEKHGADVELIDLVLAGPNVVQAICGGSADAGLTSYMAVISAAAEKFPIIAVSDIQSSIGSQALEEFFVRKDSNVKTIDDLKRKRIAINIIKSSFHYTWLMALDNEGLSASDVEFVVLPFDQQELALLNGSVDAIGLMLPYTGRARRNPGIKTLYTALDAFGERQFCVHIFNSEWAGKNPELAKAFVGAVAEAAAWIENNQDDAKEIISKYTGIDVQYIDDYRFQENAAVIMDDAQYWLDYMRDTGEITAEWLHAGDFATNKFNPALEE